MFETTLAATRLVLPASSTTQAANDLPHLGAWRPIHGTHSMGYDVSGVQRKSQRAPSYFKALLLRHGMPQLPALRMAIDVRVDHVLFGTDILPRGHRSSTARLKRSS